jgi:hypothetical protein
MGSTLFGQQIKDTYDGLIKTSDSLEITDTSKYLSDGLGNDTPLSLSTNNVAVGNLAPVVKMQVTESTNGIETLRVDNSGGNIGSVQGVSHLGLSFFSVGNNSPVRLTSYQNGVSGWPGGFAISTRNENADVAPTEKLRITSDGALLVGTTTKGSTVADVVQRNGDMYMLSNTEPSVAAEGTSTIIVTTSASVGFQGLLVVAVTGVNDPNVRTQATYSVFGRGSDFTATLISSADGLTGPAAFTITSPVNGYITVTNDELEACSVYMQFFGGLSA